MTLLYHPLIHLPTHLGASREAISCWTLGSEWPEALENSHHNRNSCYQLTFRPDSECPSLLLTLLVSSGCRHKIAQMGQLKRQKLGSHSSGGWSTRDQGANTASFSSGPINLSPFPKDFRGVGESSYSVLQMASCFWFCVLVEKKNKDLSFSRGTNSMSWAPP